MRTLVRRVSMAMIALALLSAIAYAFWPQPVPVDLVTVERGLLRVTVDEEGQTRVRERYVISSPLSGWMSRIELKAGDAVEVGAALARIEPADPALLDVRAEAEAEARVRAASAALGRAEALLESARASMDFFISERKRLESASQRGAATQREVDAARVQATTAIQDVQAAEAARDVAAFELEQAQAALIRSRPDAGAQSQPFEIRSPIEGQVFRVLQESASLVQPGTALLEIGDPADLEIVMDVLSTDAVQVVPGTAVIIERWGGDRDLAGRVRRIEPSGFTKISALGVEEQRVNIIIDFAARAEERAALGDGYRIEGKIVVWEEPDVVKAPAGALFRDRGEWAAFVLEDGRAVLRRVVIGRQNGMEAEVINGLQAGDQVIAHPSDRIRDGVRVTPR